MEYVRLAVIFISGIYMSERISPFFAVIFCISLILVLTIKAVFKHTFNVKILLFTIAFTAGVLVCRHSMSAERHDFTAYEGRYVTVTGMVTDMPAGRYENTRCTVLAREISYKGTTVKTKEKLLVTTPYTLKYGDSITFSGFVSGIPERMNEDGFDAVKYYKSKNIFHKMYTPHIEPAPYTIRDHSPYGLSMRFKCFASELIDKRYGGDFAAILKAVLTGNKREFSNVFDAVLDRTGLKRFYYPAYLHVMLLMSAVTLLLGFLDKKYRSMAMIALLVIYAAVNFTNGAALRLCTALTLITIFKLRYGYVHYPDVVGITSILTGIVNPLLFYDAGFVMSLLSSILVYYFYDDAVKLFVFVPIKYVRRMLTVGVICNVGLIPVSAYLFGGVSICSVFVSFIMLPCVAVILIISPLLLAMLSVSSSAPLASQAVSAMLFVLKNVPILADKTMVTSFLLPKPDIVTLFAYLSLVIAAVKAIKRKREQMYTALIVAAALCLSVGINELTRMNNIEITFVNVGQGDGAIISAPHKFNILIDGGGGNNYSDYNPGETLFLDYLRKEGITEIDSAFVSHYHKDHVQGIIAAIENLRVRNVFMPDSMEGGEWRLALENTCAEHGTKIHYIKEEILLRYKNGMTIRVIPPAFKTAALSDDENDTSDICYVTYGGFSAMFTGDMSRFAEGCLLEGGRVPHADLLKVAHHGSQSATSAEWIDAVDPLYSVISVGENNTYDLPDEEVLAALKSTVIYRTDEDGDVRFTIGKNGIRDIKTFDRELYR